MREADLNDAPWKGTDDVVWARVARMAELGVMTSSLLHELRQPLFALKGQLELTAASLPEDKRSGLARALKQVKHLEDLVERYGTLGRDAAQVEQLSLRAAIQQAMELLAVKAKAIQASLELAHPEDEVYINFRSSAFRQVLVNLLHNGLDAVSEHPERRVTVEVHHITDDAVHLSVQDTGPGFAEDMTEQFFDAFVTTKSEGKGTGLGLYISRKLVEDHGGEIRISSRAGGGAQVWLTLPRAS